MLTSINPLGERARGNSYLVVIAMFTAASVIGGATTGLLLGAVGALLSPTDSTALLLSAAACFAAATLDLSGRSVPSGRRQVDEDWLTRYRSWVYAVGFGWQLGTGVVTIVTSAATYCLLVLLLLQGSIPAAVGIGLVFGLVRALPVLTGRTADTPARLRTLAASLERRARTAARATGAVLAVSGIVLTGTAV